MGVTGGLVFGISIFETTIAPSLTPHLPPLWFLLLRLCPVFADTFQPVRSLPLKMETKPVSSNSSGFFERRFSITYDRKVGISAPPAGIAPNGNPIAVPRSHGFHERE